MLKISDFIDVIVPILNVSYLVNFLPNYYNLNRVPNAINYISS